MELSENHLCHAVTGIPANLSGDSAPRRLISPIRAFVAALCIALCLGQAAAASVSHKWVDTWGQAMTSNYRQVDAVTAGVGTDRFEQTTYAAPRLHDVTVRQTVLSSLGGHRARIRLSNYYGRVPLTVTRITLALGVSGATDLTAIVPDSSHRLRFGGKASVTIPPGQSMVSDPVDMSVPALTPLVISVYFRGDVSLADVHPMESAATTDVVTGDATLARSLAGMKRAPTLGKHGRFHIYLIEGVEVSTTPTTRSVVAFGDSITDGAYATSPSRPWPEVIANLANGPRGNTPAAVVNAGIGGNELTVDQRGNPAYGTSGLKRFERDVIDRPGVTDVVVLFGTNDINRGTGPAGYPDGASAGDIIASLRMLIDVAHVHHLRIYGGTITPFAGFPIAGWYTPEKERARRQVNHWIRTSAAFDGVIDFARAVAGQYHPSALAGRLKPLPPGLARVCAGDAGLHPNDRGYEVMGVLAYDKLFDADLKPTQPCH